MIIPEEIEVSIEPNPVYDYLNLKNSLLQTRNYNNWTISDMYGNKLSVESTREDTFVADVHHLSRGIYVLSYIIDETPKSIKFVKL